MSSFFREELYRIGKASRHLGVSNQKKKTILYSRVSTQGQKKDLETQELLLEYYAIENRYKNILKLRDIASGLNGKRLGLNRLFKLINNNEVDTIIVNYKDRLMRFGFDYLESYFKFHRANIIVLNLEDVQDPHKEIIEDLIAIVTSFSDKIYGLRSHKAKKIVTELKQEVKS